MALLTLQSLVYLPVLIFLTKSTVIVLAIVVVCGLIYVRSRPQIVRSRPQIMPLSIWFSFLVVGAISAVWSITPGQSIERAAKISLFLVLLGGLIHVVRNWSLQDRQYLAETGLKAWWVALALMLPILAAETAIKDLVVSFASSEESRYIILVWKPVSNNAVIILVVTFFPMLGHALSTGRPKLHVLLALIGLFAATQISGSTSALLGLIAGLVIWILCSRYFRYTKKILTVVLPLAVLAMPVLVYPLAKNPEPITQSIPNFPNSFIHRLLIWDFTLERIAERPLLGWGLDTSRAIPGGTDLRHIHYVRTLVRQTHHPSRSKPAVASAQRRASDLARAWIDRRSGDDDRSLEIVANPGCIPA